MDLSFTKVLIFFFSFCSLLFIFVLFHRLFVRLDVNQRAECDVIRASVVIGWYVGQ